jgi:hypothetical protein
MLLKSVSRWDEFVKAIQARFSAPEKVENLEVKDEEEEKRDNEAKHNNSRNRSG